MGAHECPIRQARETRWGDSTLPLPSLPLRSRQHNPVSEHLPCLNFILWCCLLIGQTWLTASEVRSDRPGATGPQHRVPNGRERGNFMLDTGESGPQTSAARPGARLGVGGPRGRLGGGQGAGRWGPPRHPDDQAPGFLGWGCIWTPFSSLPGHSQFLSPPGNIAGCLALEACFPE